MNTAYVALGANLGKPLDQLNQAITLVNKLSDTEVVAAASIYQSIAVGPGEQPDYLNSAAQIVTELNPRELLAALQAIEDVLGRVRTVHWGERTLDLDLLLYENYISTAPILTVPHPRMYGRNFVIYPLLEIAPTLMLPNGESIKTVAQKLVNQPSTYAMD